MGNLRVPKQHFFVQLQLAAGDIKCSLAPPRTHKSRPEPSFAFPTLLFRLQFFNSRCRNNFFFLWEWTDVCEKNAYMDFGEKKRAEKSFLLTLSLSFPMKAETKASSCCCRSKAIFLISWVEFAQTQTFSFYFSSYEIWCWKQKSLGPWMKLIFMAEQHHEKKTDIW